jgi:hypothetical protein
MTMAAMLCSEAAIPQLTAGFDAVVAGAAERYGTSPDAEIHVTAMVSRIDGWEDLPDVSAAVNLVHEAIDVMCGIDEVQFVTRGLDVVKQRAKGYPEVWGPRRVSMQHVLEYCNEVMRNRGSFMVVADDMAKPDEHRNLLNLYRQTGTPGFRHSTLERVLDNIYFMPSHYARGLQAADVLAGVHRRWQTQDDTTDARSVEATNAMWRKFWDSGKLRAYGCWP